VDPAYEKYGKLPPVHEREFENREASGLADSTQKVLADRLLLLPDSSAQMTVSMQIIEFMSQEIQRSFTGMRRQRSLSILRGSTARSAISVN
jgi:hypothetical protein